MTRPTVAAMLFLIVALEEKIANAQTTRPLSNLIQRSSIAATQPGAKAGGGAGILPVALSLGAVLGLIVLLYWGTRKLAPRGSFASTSGAIRVLARTPVTGRHRICVILVGRRIVVAAEGPQQMSTLCQIDDPDEVAALLGQLQMGGRASSASLVASASTIKPAPEADPELGRTREELAGLMERVRGLSSQIERERA